MQIQCINLQGWTESLIRTIKKVLIDGYFTFLVYGVAFCSLWLTLGLWFLNGSGRSTILSFSSVSYSESSLYV